MWSVAQPEVCTPTSCCQLPNYAYYSVLFNLTSVQCAYLSIANQTTSISVYMIMIMPSINNFFVQLKHPIQ